MADPADHDHQQGGPQDAHAALVTQDGISLDLAIRAWLATKERRSQSRKTARAYQDTLERFRWALQHAGMDLDHANEHVVTLAAQAWAATPWDPARRSRVSATTFNQRLAILSSFYTFARAYGATRPDPSAGASGGAAGARVPLGNPIAVIERARVQDYAGAHALAPDEVAARVAAIERASATGLRDYALIGVALVTGRRLAELAAMNVGDIAYARVGATTTMTVTFPRAKGAKVMHDELPPAIAAALLAYLQARPDYATLPAGAPVWLNHSTYHNGDRLSEQAIADVWARRLGTSKVHATRHTFAQAMEQAGAKVSDIQARLGHSNLATTGRYLAALRSAHNQHADALAAVFGYGASASA